MKVADEPVVASSLEEEVIVTVSHELGIANTIPIEKQKQ